MAEDRFKKLRFGDICVHMGFMTMEQVEYAVSQKEITKERLGRICVREGLLDEEQLAMVMASLHYYQYIELDQIRDRGLMDLVPSDLMEKYLFIPYEKRPHEIVIATSEPMNFIKIMDELEILLDSPVSIVVASEKRIRDILKRFESDRDLLESLSYEISLPLVRESDKGEETLSLEKVSAEESPIVKLVDSTILDAINKKASDIHIESSDQGVIIRYRIDGMLHQATEPFDIRYQTPMVSRIKVMSELDISEKRIPQDGRFKVKVKDRYIDFRVSILPTIFGEDVVVRILDRETLMPDTNEFTLDSINLPGTELSRIRRLIKAPYGMFLVTGPTGSGKTTLVYAAISEINNPNDKIITIEDPVEYQIKGITQIQVNEKKGLTFARGLRSILRHDPDKILVGEIRDSETAQIALQSALTGHLVFTTVHANSSFEVINRFLHMGVESFNLVSALNCIIAQRLIRILCECKRKVLSENLEDYLLDSGLDFRQLKDTDFYEEKGFGCDICKGSGYKGRKAIIELIEMNDEMKEIFLERESISDFKRRAKDLGVIFLREAAVDLVLRGETSIKEANRVTLIENL